MREKTNTAKNLRCLCEGAIFIALATVFALLRFPPFRIDLWIFGGSIDFVMLPLFIMCWRIPARFSIPACFIFGIIKFIITGDSISQYGGFLAVLLDYILAYGAVGVAALLRNLKGGFFMGVLAGSVARFVVHYISGITIWAIAFGDSYSMFGIEFSHSTGWLYSLVYNGSYMLGELIFCLILGALLYFPLKKIPKIG
ncbi:MAG: energy-coupled thiamine transporter ThiT [Clostridia bacterium]|nr:energy-coupled thiamine transporter ThiT [Clostridia bacterium]MBR5278660.1 energy-coupled thiamine transporter ThiT [Clostridia bacterium]